MAGPQAFAVLFLAFLGLLGATHAFLAATPSTSNGVAVSTSRRFSGITDLYTAEDLPPERRKLMVVRLGTFNVRKKSQPNKLDEVVWGRWKLEEESIDRPSEKDLKLHGAKLKPTRSRYNEDLLFDLHGSLMITNADTHGYGVGWAWAGLQDMYSAPTLKFRINRKGVGIDYDEFDDINDMPSMFFFSGTFTDGAFNRIEGVVERNRDLYTPPGEKRVVVKVGTFTMVKEPDTST